MSMSVGLCWRVAVTVDVVGVLLCRCPLGLWVGMCSVCWCDADCIGVFTLMFRVDD
jgi:hypothetical protein